jgi:hypothetical protein
MKIINLLNLIYYRIKPPSGMNKSRKRRVAENLAKKTLQMRKSKCPEKYRHAYGRTQRAFDAQLTVHKFGYARTKR